MKTTSFLALVFAIALLTGCVNTQVLPAHRITVRVVDATTGTPIPGATVSAWLHSRVAHVPDIEFPSTVSDAQGLALVVAPERKVQIRGFDHNWAGGYNTWPWIRAAHPDYESSGGYMGHHTEAIVTEKGELLYRLIRKAPSQSSAAGTSNPGAARP